MSSLPVVNILFTVLSHTYTFHSHNETLPILGLHIAQGKTL